MRRRNYYLSLVLAVLATSAAAGELAVERVGPEHGLAHNAVHALLEDREGFLWIGTQDGLQRYDGVDFETFRADGSELGLSHSSVTALFETPDGTLWIGTTVGLDTLSPDRRHVSRASPLPTSATIAVTRIAQSLSGEITVSTRGQGLITVKRSGSSLELSTLIESPQRILDHSWTPEGHILVVGYFGEGFGMARYDARGTLLRHDPLPVGNSLTLDDAEAFGGARLTTPVLKRGFFSDTRNWLWRTSMLVEGADVVIGSAWGLYRQSQTDSDSERVTLSGVEPGLATEVLDLLRDRSGTLWIGTYGGLLRADPARKAFYRLPADSDSPPDAISSILPTADGGSLLVGTFGNGAQVISLTDGSRLRRILPAELSDGVCSNYIWRAVETPSGELVVATNSGLCSFTRSGALAAVLSRGNYRHSEPDGQGGLWVAGPSSLLRLSPDSRSAEDFAFPSETVRSVSPTELWLGPLVTQGAPPEAIVTRLDPTTRETRRYPLGRQASVYDLEPMSEGKVLLATTDGLLRLDADSGQVESLLPATEIGVVYSVQPGSDDVVWLGTSRGLVRAVLVADTASARVFGVDDGVSNREFNRRSRLRTRDGRIFLGGMAGVTAFDPAEIASNLYAPPTRLKSVEIEGRDGRRSVSRNEVARLHPRDFAVDFEFAALNFTRAERNRYKYRVSGVDRGWVEAGTRRSARYAGLPPGSYSFEVVGSNNDGVWSSEPASFEFEVLPPLHQTWWARLLALALIAGLLAWLYGLRTRRLIEIERMRLRIASDLHDELGSELSGIALASSLVGRSESLPESQRQRLVDVAASSRRVMEGLRDIVWYVNPEHNRFDSLVDRMRDTARRLSGETEVAFSANPLPRSPRLDMQARRQLFLIYKELLNNALRHSGGTRIHARLAHVDNGLELSVADNGVGFDPAAQSNGSGLGSVRRRAKHLGGEFSIQPGAPTGSRATLRIPLT